MFEETIDRSLARDPEHRYQTSEELRAALENALEEPVRRQRRRRGVAYAVLGSMALAVGLGVFVGSKDPEVRARAQATLGPMLSELRGAPPAAAAQAQVPVTKTITVQENGMGSVEEGDSLDEAQPVAQLEELPQGEGGDSAAAADDEVIDLDASEAETADDEAAQGDEDKLAEAKPVQGEDEAGEEEPAAEEPEPKDAKVAAAIVEAQDMMRAGKRIKGLNKLRRIGRNNRKSAPALRAWSMAAEEMKNWGEAYRVARQWAEVDESVPAQIHLARLQRAVGKKDHAIGTLAKLLDKEPECMEARELMRAWGGKSKVALR